MKILNKVVFIIIAIIIGAVMFSNNAFALEDWDTMKNKADAFIQEGKNQGGDTVISETDLQNFAMPIARTLLAIAGAVACVVTVIMGIQYSMASPSDKAKLKQKLIGLVISVIVIFGAQGIWALLYKFMLTVTN